MTEFTLPGADGVVLSAVEWPGDPGRSVLAVHATGFCKEVWEPVAAGLALQGVRVVAIDQRGHGSSAAPPASPDWWGLGRDVMTVAGATGPYAIGLGHSSGATAATMANLLVPGLLPGLVLIEPVVFPSGASYDAGLAQLALRRRATFPSLDEARRHFAGRGIFSRWHPDALEGYLRGGLRRSNGGWELACPPQLEAQFYELGTSHGVWERLGELTVPVQLLMGEQSTFQVGSFALDQAAAYRADLMMVPDTDHFLPMQQPQAIVDAVVAALAA